MARGEFQGPTDHCRKPLAWKGNLDDISRTERIDLLLFSKLSDDKMRDNHTLEGHEGAWIGS